METTPPTAASGTHYPWMASCPSCWAATVTHVSAAEEITRKGCGEHRPGVVNLATHLSMIKFPVLSYLMFVSVCQNALRGGLYEIYMLWAKRCSLVDDGVGTGADLWPDGTSSLDC